MKKKLFSVNENWKKHSKMHKSVLRGKNVVKREKLSNPGTD